MRAKSSKLEFEYSSEIVASPLLCLRHPWPLNRMVFSPSLLCQGLIPGPGTLELQPVRPQMTHHAWNSQTSHFPSAPHSLMVQASKVTSWSSPHISLNSSWLFPKDLHSWTLATKDSLGSALIHYVTILSLTKFTPSASLPVSLPPFLLSFLSSS